MPRVKKPHLKRRSDGRFRCRYKNLDFYGLSEAEALDARSAYIAAEKSGDVFRSSVSVFEYASAWLPRSHPAVSESTYRGLAIHLEKLTRRLGDVPMAEVLPSQIKEVFSEDYRDLSASYIRGARQLYCALFDAAVSDRICRSNPVRERSAQPHRGSVGGHRAITDQERRWIDSLCLNHRARPAVLLMLYAGLRPQEVKAFDIDRSVDFSAGVIRLRDFVHLSGWNNYEISGEGKTSRAVREIPLLDPVREALEGRHGLVATSASGAPVTVQAWRSLWESYVSCMEEEINGCSRRWYGKRKKDRDAVLPPWVSFSVVPYDLRHSFCVFCRDRGVELNTCIRWMGHADSKMILRVYDEVSADRSRAEAEKLKKPAFRGQIGGQTDSASPVCVDK